MGFGSSLKKITGLSSSGLIGGLVGGLAGSAIVGTLGGEALNSLNKQRNAAGQANLTPEQITTANLFQNLSREQQKDLLLNNPNIEGPGGRQVFDPLTNTIRIEESEFQKGQRGRQEQLASELSGQLMGQDLPGTDGSARFEQGRELLQPQFQQDRERLSQQLADQGLPAGSEAHTRELNRLEQSQGRQLQELSFNAVQTAEAQRAARFNEISSLLGQAQVGGVGFNQFQAGFSGLDLFGAEQAGLNRQFQANQAKKDRSAQQKAAIIGALGSMGSSAIEASDERLKENIKKIGTSPSGLNIYSFKYKDKPGIYQGVIAQELQESNPKAVVTKDGFLAVDYSLIDVDFIKYDSK
jgi:hypothetical protein